MDLQISSLGASVFYGTRRHTLRFCEYSDLISHTYTHKHTHTHTHTYTHTKTHSTHRGQLTDTPVNTTCYVFTTVICIKLND